MLNFSTVHDAYGDCDTVKQIVVSMIQHDGTNLPMFKIRSVFVDNNKYEVIVRDMSGVYLFGSYDYFDTPEAALNEGKTIALRNIIASFNFHTV